MAWDPFAATGGEWDIRDAVKKDFIGEIGKGLNIKTGTNFGGSPISLGFDKDRYFGAPIEIDFRKVFPSKDAGAPDPGFGPQLTRYRELKKGIADSEYLTDEERQKFTNELSSLDEFEKDKLRISDEVARRYGVDKDPNKALTAIDSFITELADRFAQATEKRRKEKEASMDIRNIQKAAPGFYQAESVNTGTALTRK